MECQEKKIRGMILDYVEGALESRKAERVRAHLTKCQECRKLEQEYRESVAGLKAVFQDAAAQHISNEELIKYADNPDGIEENVRESIELHTAICSSCREKVTMLQRVGEELSISQSPSAADKLRRLVQRIKYAPGRRLAVSIAAAAVVVLVAIYWSMIGGDRLAIQFTSADNIIWLQESTRNGQVIPGVHERNGRIIIGMKFQAFFSEENYTVQLQTAEGDTVQEKEIRKGDYNILGVGLEIVTSSLASGEYKLILISRKLEDKDYIIEAAYPFILLRD